MTIKCVLQDSKVCMTSYHVTLHTGIATGILFITFTYKHGSHETYNNENNCSALNF